MMLFDTTLLLHIIFYHYILSPFYKNGILFCYDYFEDADSFIFLYVINYFSCINVENETIDSFIGIHKFEFSIMRML